MAATKESTKVASDFEKIINSARDRKKNEALAAKIFSKDRRSSTPVSKGAGPISSRAGVKKQRGATSTKPRHSTGNIDGEWTHDLHEVDSNQPPASAPKGPKAANSLAARIRDPNAGPAGSFRQKRRAAQVAQALIRTELQPQINIKNNKSIPTGPAATRRNNNAPATGTVAAGGAAGGGFNKGISIRGLAGPYVVIAQNFAPGTTAADIESAVTPVGGLVTSCRVLKQKPIVIAEIVFESKEGADNVIETFHRQTADGRVLHVQYKVPNVPTQDPSPTSSSWQRGYAGAAADTADDMVVDGTMGFDDPIEADDVYSAGAEGNGNGNGNGNGKVPPTGPAAGRNGGLYSDSIVRPNQRGRGFQGRR